MLDVLCSVVLCYAASTEVHHLYSKNLSNFNLSNWGYVRVPPVVEGKLLLPYLFLHIYRHNQSRTIFSHGSVKILSLGLGLVGGKEVRNLIIKEDVFQERRREMGLSSFHFDMESFDSYDRHHRHIFLVSPLWMGPLKSVYYYYYYYYFIFESWEEKMLDTFVGVFFGCMLFL